LVPAVLRAVSDKISAGPENPELYIERALIYLDREDGNKAFADANKAISLRAGVAKYYIVLSDACLMLGKVNECKAALEQAVNLDKLSTEAYLKLAELNLYFKDYMKVFLYTEQVLDIDAYNAKAFFIRGFALKEKGDTTASVKAFRQAVESNQQYYDAYIQLGLIFAAKRDKLAAEYYKTAIKLRPQSIEAFYNLGMYYQENDALNEAMEAYRTILKLDPKYKFAYFNLGYIHMYYLRVYPEAVKYFTGSLEVDPNYAEAWYNRGYCRELMGDEMNAREDYTKAMSIRPNYKLAMEGMARLERRGK